MGASLEALLRKCEHLDEVVAAILGADRRPVDKRQMVTWAYCAAATEHAVAQRVLIERRLTGTALALVRLQYETTLRAAWTHHGAKTDWLDKFTSPVPPGSFDEPRKGPDIEAMLQTLGKHIPPQNIAELRNLNSTLKVMHSFVHGGVRSVVHALHGYPEDTFIGLLTNRNLLLWFSSQVFALSTNDAEVQKRLRETFAALRF